MRFDLSESFYVRSPWVFRASISHPLGLNGETFGIFRFFVGTIGSKSKRIFKLRIQRIHRSVIIIFFVSFINFRWKHNTTPKRFRKSYHPNVSYQCLYIYNKNHVLNFFFKTAGPANQPFMFFPPGYPIKNVIASSWSTFLSIFDCSPTSQ